MFWLREIGMKKMIAKSVSDFYVSGVTQKNQEVQNAKNIGVLVKILKFQGVHLQPLTYTQHRHCSYPRG
jgi:hypothetical protein